jgi:hypothetical protein
MWPIPGGPRPRLVARPRVKTAARALLLAVALGVAAACSKDPENDPDVVYPEFVDESAVTIGRYDADAMEPFVTRDGRYLFFNSLNDGITTSLYYALRTDDTHFALQGEIAGVNGVPPHLDAVASMDAAAAFFYVSTRSYPAEIRNLRSGRFSDGAVTDVRPVDGDFYISSPAGWIVMDAEISSDGRALYYVNARFDGRPLPAEARLGVARKQGGVFVKDRASDSLLARVNSDDYLVYAPATAAGTNELYFTRLRKGSFASEVCVSIRTDADDVYSLPRRLEISGDLVEAPSLTNDGARIYYHKRTDDGRYRVFTMRRR